MIASHGVPRWALGEQSAGKEEVGDRTAGAATLGKVAWPGEVPPMFHPQHCLRNSVQGGLPLLHPVPRLAVSSSE